MLANWHCARFTPPSEKTLTPHFLTLALKLHTRKNLIYYYIYVACETYVFQTLAFFSFHEDQRCKYWSSLWYMCKVSRIELGNNIWGNSLCAIKKDCNALCASGKVQRSSAPLLQLFCALHATAVSLGSMSNCRCEKSKIPLSLNMLLIFLSILTTSNEKTQN